MAKKKKIIILAVCGFLLGCFLWSIYETYFLDFKTTVYNIKDSDIPANWQGKKIVFVADLHSEFFLPKKRLAKLIKKINDQKADLVLFGGDYIEGDPAALPAVFAELSKIQAKIGKFGVLGNHDWEDSQLAKVEMEKAGNAGNLNINALLLVIISWYSLTFFSIIRCFRSNRLIAFFAFINSSYFSQ